MDNTSLIEIAKALEAAVMSGTAKAKPSEIISTLFKHSVSRMFEKAIVSKTDGTKSMRYDAILETKRGLIQSFLNANLGDYQKSTEWYEKLFDSTVQEILSFASQRHKGNDIITLDQGREFSINTNMIPPNLCG